MTKNEIKEWVDSRDWVKATAIKNPTEFIPYLKKNLPNLSSRTHPYDQKIADKVADIVAAVADTPDRIADYLYSTLTLTKSNNSLLDIL